MLAARTEYNKQN